MRLCPTSWSIFPRSRTTAACNNAGHSRGPSNFRGLCAINPVHKTLHIPFDRTTINVKISETYGNRYCNTAYDRVSATKSSTTGLQRDFGRRRIVRVTRKPSWSTERGNCDTDRQEKEEEKKLNTSTVSIFAKKKRKNADSRERASCASGRAVCVNFSPRLFSTRSLPSPLPRRKQSNRYARLPRRDNRRIDLYDGG